MILCFACVCVCSMYNVCVCVCVCLHIFIRIHTYMHVYMYVYIYTHTYTYVGGDAPRDCFSHVYARGPGVFNDSANLSCRQTNSQKSGYFHRVNIFIE